jgi:hypothetical protein
VELAEIRIEGTFLGLGADLKEQSGGLLRMLRNGVRRKMVVSTNKEFAFTHPFSTIAHAFPPKNNSKQE